MVEFMQRQNQSGSVILGLLLVMMTAQPVLADNGSKPIGPTAPAVDRETEDLVHRLVQSHLPELTTVLKQLRGAEPREYERAIQDLSKSARKLESAQNRDQRLFEIEVELLQAQYQTSLLTAKLKVRDSQSDRRRLHEAVSRLHGAQVVRAEYDVEFYRHRLARSQQQLDAAISRLESRNEDADREVEKSFQTMLRKAGRDSKADESDAKVEVKRPGQRGKTTRPSTATDANNNSRDE